MSERESGRPAMAGRKELGKDTRGVIIQILRGYPVCKAAGIKEITMQKAYGNFGNANIELVNKVQLCSNR